MQVSAFIPNNFFESSAIRTFTFHGSIRLTWTLSHGLARVRLSVGSFPYFLEPVITTSATCHNSGLLFYSSCPAWPRKMVSDGGIFVSDSRVKEDDVIPAG